MTGPEIVTHDDYVVYLGGGASYDLTHPVVDAVRAAGEHPADQAATAWRWAADNLTACPWGETAEHGCDWPLMAERLRAEADKIDPC